jgi:RNA polymerase sigma-70 factor, ECF subfamily
VIPIATGTKALELAGQKALTGAAAPNETARLTRLMQRGDEKAYREFFKIYFHRLHAYLLVVTRGNEALARDLVQQTMIKVAKHIRVFEDEAVLWRWVTLLARTAAVDEGRKSQRYFAFLQRWWHGRDEAAESSSVQEDRFEVLVGAGLDQLEPEDRLVLEKKYWDECSVREIAAELGTSEKAVESRLSRVRAKLKARVMKGLNHE